VAQQKEELKVTISTSAMLVNELQASFPGMNLDKKLPNGPFKNLISTVGKGLQMKRLGREVTL